MKPWRTDTNSQAPASRSDKRRTSGIRIAAILLSAIGALYGSSAATGTTVWRADMTVTDYGNGNIGAGSASLLANQSGTAGLQARWLYYDGNAETLRMAFTSGVAGSNLTLHAGDVEVDIAGDGDSSFSWSDFDVEWTDGQTFEARIASGESDGSETPPANTTATGAPTIIGTAQVGKALVASVDEIEDADGVASATYAYQWLSNDGTDDTEIAGANGATHEVAAAEVGKTLKVRVTFTDDADTEETLTSKATETVTRPPPRAPTIDGIAVHDGMLRMTGGRLQLSDSSVPAADVSSYISSFKVQWKSGSQSYDATRQAVLAPEPVTASATFSVSMPSYDITGLTNGTEYTVRVIATNAGGDSPASQEQTATPKSKAEQLRQYIEDEIVETHEASHPWLRQTWSYLQSNNIPLSVTTGEVGDIDTYSANNASGLSGRYVRSWTVTESIVDGTQATKKRSLVGDLAYIYTRTNGLSSSPAPLGIANVYFRSLDSYVGCYDIKLYLDVVASLVTHGSLAAAQDWKAWMARSEDATALAVVRSALSGQTPAWFAQTYHDEDGDPDLEQFWSDVRTTGEKAVAYQLRDAFGGYCDTNPSWELRIVRSMNRVLTGAGFNTLINPWQDGGCIPGAPTSLSANRAEDDTATVSWEAPPSNGGSLLSGYRIEWQSTDAGDGATPSTKEVEYNEWSNETRPNQVSETIDGLTDSSAYTVRVVAYNPNGDGAAAEVTVDEATTPEAPAPEGLTATFENMPAEHDGATRFTFRLTFSEEPQISYRVLRNQGAFTVTGGHLRQTKRVEKGSNLAWNITIEPSGRDDIEITLVGQGACGTTGAVCTADGDQLSNSPNATVQGPAAISIADASAREGTDATMNFTVTLDRAAIGTVTVDYATSDGTATAGEDYTTTQGTVTFAQGETEETIAIAILDDAKDEGEETLLVALFNARNSYLDDDVATGTIVNSDPLQREWLARFGRTVASEVIDGIGARLQNKAAGSEIRIAGVTLRHGAGGTWTEDREQGEAHNPGAFERLEGHQQSLTAGEALMASAFRMQSTNEQPGAATWTAWGRFSSASFEGEEESVKLSGDVTTGLVGADVGTDEWTAGLALSAAKGDGPFTLTSEMPSNRSAGTVESDLTSFHPYGEIALSERIAFWGVGGFGSGQMTIREDDATPISADIDMTMAAIGLRGNVLEAARGDGVDLVLKSDAMWLQIESDDVPNLTGVTADVTRLRLTSEVSRAIALTTGTLTPRVEFGLRQDGGDAEEGVGFEAGGGLAYQDRRVSIEATMRTLVAHDDSAYEEWGASAAVRINPGSDGRGMSLSITPSWGNAASRAAQLWSTRSGEDLVSDAEFETEHRLDAELGYGLAGPHGFGTLTLYAALSLTNGAERTG